MEAIATISIDYINWAAQFMPIDNIFINYIKNSYKNDPYRVIIELLLFFYAMKYILKRKTTKDESDLTQKEIDTLIEEWKPEPLVESTQYLCCNCSKSTSNEKEQQFITGKHGVIVTINSRAYLNCSSNDILAFSQNADLTVNAKKCLRTYGVGTCGPRGFYGTLDIHLDFEEKFAHFLGVEAAILYSQAFSTVLSTIPAFAKRGDIIVADESCNIAIKQGMNLSRSKIFFHKHNDMKDLERVLKDIAKDYKKSICRKFIITEGLFQEDFSLCCLSELVALKKEYKYRLMIDETFSIGSLGSNGKGLSQLCGIDSKEIDIIVGSLAHAFGAGGGFCAGSVQIVDHQRLSSQAYCFSASLPAILASTAILTMTMMNEKDCQMFVNLNQMIKNFNQNVSRKGKHFEVVGSAKSPFRYLVPIHTDSEQEDISQFIKKAFECGILFSQMHVEDDARIKLTVSTAYTKAQFNSMINFINKNM